MPVADGIEVLNSALIRERDERIFRQWLALLPNMTRQNFIAYDKFKQSIVGADDIDTRPAQEILAELDELEKQFERGENT